jgi:hypothetical protein
VPDDDTALESPQLAHTPSHGGARFVAPAITVLSILGSIALVIAAVATTEIDIDDLFDSLEPVRIPALLCVTMVVVASLFLAGRRWARWVLAIELAAGTAWIILVSEISGTWLRVALVVAVVWGLSAVTLAVSRSIRQHLEAMADHWMVGYERLLGPLESEEDARRWLGKLDTWDDAGVLTPGDRRRVTQALASWAERIELLEEDVKMRIAGLTSGSHDHRLMTLLRRLVKRP